MSAVLPPQLRPRFVVMHFFNPVRYMRLLEVAPGPKTRPELVERMARFGEWLGKGIVYAKDTTNFVANRIGVYGMMLTMHTMLEARLGIDTSTRSRASRWAQPESAAFDTADLVGLDTLVHVAKNCYDTPDERRAARRSSRIPEFVTQLVAGRAASAARRAPASTRRSATTSRSSTSRRSSTAPQEKVRFDSLGAVRNNEDPEERLPSCSSTPTTRPARFAWKVLSRTLAYSARRCRRDRRRRRQRRPRHALGLQLGPRSVRGVGRDWRRRVGRAHGERRHRAAGLGEGARRVGRQLLCGRRRRRALLRLRDAGAEAGAVRTKESAHRALKRSPASVIKKNFGASLVDLGDGALGVEVHTKMNTLDPDVIGMLSEGVRRGREGLRGHRHRQRRRALRRRRQPDADHDGRPAEGVGPGREDHPRLAERRCRSCATPTSRSWPRRFSTRSAARAEVAMAADAARRTPRPTWAWSRSASA